jgi:hypothetical protein
MHKLIISADFDGKGLDKNTAAGLPRKKRKNND